MGKLSLFRKKSSSSLRDEVIDGEEKAEMAPPALPPLNIGGSSGHGGHGSGRREPSSSLVSPPKSPLDSELPQTSLLDEIFSDLSLSTGLDAIVLDDATTHTNVNTTTTSTTREAPSKLSSESTGLLSNALPSPRLTDSHTGHGSFFTSLEGDFSSMRDTSKGKSSSRSNKTQANPDSEFIDIYRKAASKSKAQDHSVTANGGAKKENGAVRSSVTTVYAAGSKQPKSRKSDKRASWRKQSENAARARAATFAAGRFADETKAYGEEESEEEEEEEETTSSDYSSTSSESDDSEAEQSDAESDASVSSGGAGLNRIGQIAVARGLARQAEREKANRIQHWAGTVEKTDNGNLAIERMKDRHRQEMEAAAATTPLAGPSNVSARAGMSRHMTTGTINPELMRAGGAAPGQVQAGIDGAVNAIHNQLADARGFARKHSLPTMHTSQSSNASDNATPMLTTNNNNSSPNMLRMNQGPMAGAYPMAQPATTLNRGVPMMGAVNLAEAMPLSSAHMQIESGHRVVTSSASTVSTGAAPSSAASSVSSNTAPETQPISDKTARKTSSKGRLQQIPSSDEEDDEEDDDDDNDDEASDDESPVTGVSRTTTKKMTAETSRSATPVNMNQRIPVVPRSPLYQQTHVIDNTAQQAMPMMMSNGMNVANVAMPHNPPHMVEPVYTANPPLTLIQQQQQMAAAAQQAKLQQQMHHATSSSQMWTPGRVNPAATISPVAVNTGAISPASTPLVAMSPAYPSPRPDMSGTVRTQPAGYVRPGQPTLLQQQQMIQQQQQQQQMQEQFNARLASRQPPLSPPSSVRNSVGFPPQRAQPFVQTVQQQQQQQQTSIPSSQPQGPAAMNRIQPLISGFSQSPLSGQ